MKDLVIKDNIILIDKEVGWTSNDVINFLKQKLNPLKKDETGKSIKKTLMQDEKRFRIGHAGTLDPFATGLLVIMLNDGTKQFDTLQTLNKEYIAEIEFGKTTDTQDVTGEVIKEFDGEIVLKNLDEVLRKNFLGKIQQIPPKYSAIKIDGKRLYHLAYKGKNIDQEKLEKKKRQVEIYEYEVLEVKDNFVIIRFVVSSGTYIRTIANDLGEALGYGAYLKSLRRTKIGDFDVEQAVKLDTLN